MSKQRGETNKRSGTSKDRDARVSRKAFLGATALAATAAALAGCNPRGQRGSAHPHGLILYAVLTPDEYDYDRMMTVIRTHNPHKQLFPATTASVQASTRTALIFMHMQFAMNGYQFSLPTSTPLATLGVFSGPAVLFGLNDDVWRKYGISQRYQLADTNVYYRATSNLDFHARPDDPKGLYQDFSAEAVLKRGGSFMICHHALTSFAAECATRADRSTEAVLKELMVNLMPGFTLVPSGITAVQLAAESGWKIYPVG